MRAAALLLLLAACGPPQIPAGKEDARFSLVSWDNQPAGEDALGTAPDGGRVEHLSASIREGRTYRLDAALTGPDLAWEAVIRSDARWERWSVGPDAQGSWRWSGRQGLAAAGGLLAGPPQALAEGLADALPGPRSSLLLWERLLQDRADHTIDALDPRTGAHLPLRVETRAEEDLTWHGTAVRARRVFAWTASEGTSAWVDEATGALLKVRGLVGWLSAVRDGVQTSAIQPRPPTGVEEAEISVTRPDLVLHGTWTRPEDRPDAPVVILLHGSGPGDRSGNYGPVRPGLFRDLAYGLAARGYAVLRYDKRGVGESQPADPHAVLSSTLDDLLGDIAAWQDLAGGNCQFLIGHSEGGYLAPARAVLDPRVAGVVLLGGPARRLDAVMAEQLPLVLQTEGASADEIRQALRVQRAAVRAILAGRDRDPTVAGLPAESRDWLVSHFRHDAEGVLRQLRTPILALFGEKDIQVPPEEAAEMARVLAESAHPDATVETVPGVDHLFLPVPLWPGLGSYTDPDRHLDPALIARIADWMDERPCGPPPG